MTGARPNTWMPFYWADYRADTSHLSAIEHGGYILLIGHYWTTGQPLPMNDAQLARIAAMSPAEWKKHSRPILAFFTMRDGIWVHGRIERELEQAAIGYTKRAEAANKRWSKHNASEAIASSKADALHVQPQPTTTIDIKNLIGSAVRRIDGPSRADTNDPRVRKQRWEQRIGNEVLGTFGPTEGARIIEAYANGDPAAKQIFNALSDGKKIDAARSTR